jgi:hypothetical protein
MNKILFYTNAFLTGFNSYVFVLYPNWYTGILILVNALGTRLSYTCMEADRAIDDQTKA